MDNNKIKVTISFFVLIISVTVTGYLFPGSLNWGFHFLGLLPSTYFFCYLIVSVVIFVYALKGDLENQASLFISRIFRKPLISVIAALFFFIIFAFTFRQRIPLLGDSFLLINNFQNTFKGMHNLVAYREPLSIYFFYWVANLLGTYTYPTIMNAYLVGEFVLGIGFILNVIFIAHCFLPDPKARILSLLFLLAGSYMQLFYGYAEIYSVVLFFISLYVLVVAFWMRQKISFYYIPVIFLFQVLAHYLTLLLLPSLLVVTYNEYKMKGPRNIMIGFAIQCTITILLLIALNFDLSRFIPPLSHSPFLSISPSSDTFQAYTLFSTYHLIDLFNLGMLLGSSWFILFGFVYLFERKGLLDSVQGKFLIACVIPIIVFIALVKLDLGMATDWDTVAPYFFLINLFAVIAFMGTQSIEKTRILFLCIAFTFMHSIVWFTVNASENPTIVRTKLLGDRRIISQQGFEQLTFHLERYYFYHGDISSIIALWEQYLERYPNDEKGYTKVIDFLLLKDEETSEKTLTLFERWLALNPDNPQKRSELANVCVQAGNVPFKEGNLKEAERIYRWANRFDPQNVVAYNNIGSVYLRNNNVDSAVQWYSKAIQIDSTYVISYENLSLAYIQRGDNKTALAIADKLIKQNPTVPAGYEILAKFYYKIGDRKNSIENLKIAARLGSSFAQKFLSQQRITW